MSSGVPYIGSKISLITTSDMRYEGFLRTLNREESTIAVESVRSFGTEGRADQTRGQSEIPVSNEIYDFIVFRGKDLKDLTVLQGIPENAPQPQPAPATRPPAQSPHMQGSYGQHLNKKSIEYDTGPGMYHPSQMAPSGPMGEGPSGGFGSSGYQRHSPPAVSRNGYGPPPSSCGGAGVGHMGDSLGGSYLSTGSRPPSEKSGYGQVRIEAPSRTPPSYHDGPHGPPPSYVERPAPSQYEDLPAGPPRGGPGCGHRMGDEGKGPAAPRPPGAMTSHVQEGKDRNGHVAYGMPGAVEGKGASAGFNPSVEAKGRGRGKGGQKQTLSEVLKTHKKAEEAIVKLMRSQGSAAVSPQELRAMSEQQSCIYHFHLDYLNFCGPASGGAVFSQQSDEQNWDSLAKALKKHFEKDFGSGPSQQKSQPQRPNNTLADFITVDTKQNSKKNAKVQPTAAKAVRGGAGRGGRGAGAKAKEVESTAAEDDDPSAGLQWTCPRCTLKNDNHLQECAACGTSKSVASLWAEFPPLGT